MHRTTRWIAAAAVVVGAALPIAACGQSEATTAKAPEPAKVEPIGDTGVKRITLTDKAVERLAIETFPVTEHDGRLVMPHAALLYLPDGTTFAYTNPEGHSYVRAPVTVESIRGEQAVLTSGPAAGTAVVTAGGAELWGAEFGIK
ncbi:hypothetical protein [Pseudonocardia asaccharolytica]|uniref:Lipoprotein n=1 Tax=Pseudonocardia asaccharolytica DSM 44247 = NBRC 16224 TaxID=1123024 RepID=A0A511D537_9PSEU|nr:hypothetical protein [Pseudonocardia asaccharolytica]GEL19912.1 hypothetical protein PA7_37490 [Pseudonocardia asaccharolytica DSM 44247 = NBRC 16224]